MIQLRCAGRSYVAGARLAALRRIPQILRDDRTYEQCERCKPQQINPWQLVSGQTPNGADKLIGSQQAESGAERAEKEVPCPTACAQEEKRSDEIAECVRASEKCC